MRASMAYFAGVGTVVAAVAVGLGGGLLISNIVSPHEPRIEMSKLEQRMSSKPIPVSNAPSEPVSYLAATAPAASSPITVATSAPQTAPQTASANAVSTQAPPAEAQGSGSAAASAPAASPPHAATPVTQAENSEKANSEQIKAPENAFAKARDADGVFIPCPRWPTITDVQLLEDEIGKPVITSSLACSWYAMTLIDIKENVRGFGRLMESLAP